MAYSRADGQPTRNGRKKYYLPSIDLNKYNVIIDGRNFYDNPIESDIEKYRELKKVMIGKAEDYTTGSLLDYNYFKEHYKLVAVDLSKQKELDADPRAIQQIEFKYMLGTNSTIYWVFEKSKETILELYKGTVKVAGPLMKVALPLAKNVLAPLGLTAAMSATDGGIQKKIHGAGVKLITEQEDMKDIMKIIEALENSGILLKGVSKTIENETKEQRGGFLSTLLGTLGASLLGNLLTGGKGNVASRAEGEGIMRAGNGIVRAGNGSKKKPKFTVTFSSFNKYRNK